MPEMMDGMSMNLEHANMDKLRAVFPECFAEGKLDIDKLLALCGEYISNDFEKYKFEWKGKAECLKLAQKRSTGTLRPCPEESVNWDSTQNLYIEGDNLEVLKLLQTAYYRKVKMIYIDPPYNTGNDFVYADDFADPMARYKEITQQTTKSNPETMGRFHTNWLNMMYPRLRLAANLLRDDGVIFISIDEHEITNLRKVCDESFGEENYVGTIIWKNATDNNPTQIAIEHEYIVCYAKRKDIAESVWKTKVSAIKDLLVNVGLSLAEEYKEPDELQCAYTEWYRANKWQLWPLDRYKYIDHEGIYTGSQSVHNPGRDGYRYDIIHPITGKPCVQPLMGYRFPESTMTSLIEEGKILFGEDHNKIVELKVYAKDYEEKLSSIFELDGRLGSYDLKNLFGAKPVFSNPKPVQLLQRLLSFITTESDIVLDFFSGSASMAEAIMKLNAIDKMNRQYICVQLPENLDRNYEVSEQKAKAIIKNSIELLEQIGKPHFLTEIGKERIRRAGAQIIEEQSAKNATMMEGQLTLDDTLGLGNQHPEVDIGFRVFRLDTSNLETWDGTPIANEQIQILYDRMNSMVQRVKSDRTDLDMVFEIMLKLGVPLTYSVNQIAINNKTAYTVGDDCLLLICLATDVAPEDVEAMAEYAPAKVIISRDSFANDTAMANAYYILRDKGIELKLV